MIKHGRCCMCELWDSYAGKCTYTTCPLDDETANETTKQAANDAAYLYWAEVEDAPRKEDEEAHARYLRHADGGDHYPDDSYYDYD